MGNGINTFTGLLREIILIGKSCREFPFPIGVWIRFIKVGVTIWKFNTLSPTIILKNIPMNHLCNKSIALMILWHDLVGKKKKRSFRGGDWQNDNRGWWSQLNLLYLLSSSTITPRTLDYHTDICVNCRTWIWNTICSHVSHMLYNPILGYNDAKRGGEKWHAIHQIVRSSHVKRPAAQSYISRYPQHTTKYTHHDKLQGTYETVRKGVIV